jgi:hypothetical protein
MMILFACSFLRLVEVEGTVIIWSEIMENRRKPAPPAATLDINCDCKEYVNLLWPPPCKRVEAKARPMTTPPFEDRAPADDRITAYDERHFVTYLRILDAAEEGADWREVASHHLRPGRRFRCRNAPAWSMTATLKRARWMTEHGYRHLLDKSRRSSDSFSNKCG